MKVADTDLGTLIERRDLPTTAGMDALEARLVVVQEVPSKADLRFYAVRGDDREVLSSEAALKTLRLFVPRKSAAELTELELVVEVTYLRAETDRMRAVYEAAKAWRAEHNENHNCCDAVSNLYAAIDAAIATEDR